LQMPNLIATFSRRSGAAAIISVAIAATSLLASPAKARHWHTHHRHSYAHSYARNWHYRHASIRYHAARASRSQSNIAAIVVDGNTGRTIYARNENEQRFPASITKVMTLYLLFEQLEQGQLRLESDILVSAFAAARKPTKLGLREGQSISVDDAIKAVVTRSANDIAVAIAESIGGDESHFAALMTQKAHELGMTRTHFTNASGLPDADQLTTAHDLAILGRAIQERFPRYYRYFATRVFYYRDAAIANHNHLLGRVEGMDGIKTGYTNASGFNLLTSVKRDGHYIVAVVLGGASARSRDNIMARLIENHIENSAIVRAASLNTSANTNTQAATALQRRVDSPGTIESQPGNSLRPAFTPDVPRPEPAEDPNQVASLKAENVPPNTPRPAFVSGAPKPVAAYNRAVQTGPGGKEPRLDGSTLQGLSEDRASVSTATPSALREGPGGTQLPAPKITARIGDLPHIATIERLQQKWVPVLRQDTRQNNRQEQHDDSKESHLALGAADSSRASEARNGWMIQIGATADIDKATELLARAKSEGPKTLARAHAFTEKVKKGSQTLYRARFAGLEADTAERICKTLKRSGFSCFATRD
jgi:D-alanyl-D-alanine carboxypeptidase